MTPHLFSSSSTIVDDENNAIKIQKWYRGCILRLKRLPLILYQIQRFLEVQSFSCSTQTSDGRINSSLDEEGVICLLTKKYGEKIKKSEKRMWYDILAHDFMYGWIPINIKSTTTKTSDNTGNLAMCVYAYTDEELDIHRENTYENGAMSRILIDKLHHKKYNARPKKDYYFIVLNKENPREIIINSVKGLNQLKGNANNLPFQVRWNKNITFTYEPIKKRITQFEDCLRNTKPSWQEYFMTNMRKRKIPQEST
jgi:hypothetical protein